ncbi:P-loop containing nucleoside triphosphate hydrolase protein [Hypoxylon sp. FL1150]|nr:P-loop containing nucleoside triphosphate hydrolase protein [Hypoxylon sp. FL1150]
MRPLRVYAVSSYTDTSKMDDTSSIASYEEIGPENRGFGFEKGLGPNDEEKHVEKLRALIAKSTVINEATKELAEDEVPSVTYVLQYKGWGGRLIDVCRSREPINIQLDDMVDEGTSSTKPILEIVTKISTQLVKKNRAPVRNTPPLRRRGWSPDYYQRREIPDYRQNEEEDAEMKIAKVEKTSLVINSVHLINALKAVVGYYPGTSFLGDSVKIQAPYQVLIHHREQLARYKVSQPTVHDAEYAFTTARHIDVLLDFLEKTLGDQIREEEERYNSAVPSATFAKLWMILKPGEVIYAKHDSRWTPFVISRVHDGSSRSEEGPTSYTIDCWNITYTSERFSRTMQSFVIDPFTGAEAITSLSVVPARFFRGDKSDTSPEAIRKKHIKLGRSVWELAKGPSYMSYDGSLVEKEPTYEWEDPVNVCTAGYMSGRIIVDSLGFARYSMDNPVAGRNRRAPPPPARPAPQRDSLPYFAPSCGCNACSKAGAVKENLSPFAEFEDLDPVRDTAPELDLYYLVLSKIVSGFVLGERRWGHFNVEDLQEIKFDKEAFKYLVLDDEVKLTVRALIGKFASAGGQVSPWPNDFVKNKGQGRIFLLHGSPGVGKTCTAECVAELTHRPLISLTSGDLSTDSYNVERNLSYFLQLGERFGAMVLLDEADVYLESRRAKDIERNGLVSIFLRALEYYRGVLFLTTNRVQTFDSAFTSRIHVALHYKALNDRDREKIWLNSFERLERDSEGKVHVGVSTREYAYESRDVRSLRWNGREIRNALQTAVALAETEALEEGNDIVSVSDRHLRAVVKMSRGFKNFLRLQKERADQDDVEDEVEEEEEDLDVDDQGSTIYDD